MKMYLTLTILIFSCNICYGQKHTDLKEYGYNGDVKKVTSIVYDSTSINPYTEKIVDKTAWRYQTEYYFNRHGSFDSIINFATNSSLPGVILNFKTIYIYKEDERVALKLDRHNNVTDTMQYFWLTDTSYKTISKDSNGDTTMKSENLLNSEYRDLAGKYIGIDSGKVNYNEQYRNEIDRNNRITRSERIDKLVNKNTTLFYFYSRIDNKKNPNIIFIRDADNRLVKVVIRKFEYY